MGNRAKFVKEILDLEKKISKKYIYGAGLYARNIYNILKQENIKIEGFVVTHLNEAKKICGLPVMGIDTVINNNIGIIIGTNSLNRVEIIRKLKQSGFDMDYVVQGTDYIESQTMRYDGTPTMEVTTRIGCSVNCKYCPQKVLANKYFVNNKNRPVNMSLRTFEKCLEKLPANARVSFCGMAEPFLNPECKEMIKMTHESGRIVELYTTFVGVDLEAIKEIAEIPFGYVTLHVADKLGYAQIPITDEYYKLIEVVINLKKQDGTPLINMCNAQAEPDARILEICRDKYDILTALHDRAGNLQDECLLNKHTPSGKITCSLCGSKLNHNNLLPDGTVLLCDFDYGMQHVLGNLLEQTYEEILSGNEWKKVYKGISGDAGQDILCRKCSCANSIS